MTSNKGDGEGNFRCIDDFVSISFMRVVDVESVAFCTSVPTEYFKTAVDWAFLHGFIPEGGHKSSCLDKDGFRPVYRPIFGAKEKDRTVCCRRDIRAKSIRKRSRRLNLIIAGASSISL